MATLADLGSFPGANDKDKSSRIPMALSNLNKALAGDAQALAYLRAQAAGSATAVGKAAFNRALAIYDQQKPATAPSSSATPPPALMPIPKPPVLLAPQTMPVIKNGPLTTWPPPAPPDIGGTTVPVSQPKPVGFDNTHDPLTYVPPTVRMRGMRSGQVKSVLIGSPDGGLITSTPASDSSAPTPTPAPADFGYVAPAPGGGPAKDVAADATTTAPDNKKIFLLLAAGVVLWLMIEGKRK